MEVSERRESKRWMGKTLAFVCLGWTVFVWTDPFSEVLPAELAHLYSTDGYAASGWFCMFVCVRVCTVCV